MSNITTTEPDLRYVDREGNRVSYLATAHAFWNGWLYPHECEALRNVNTESDAERLLRELQRLIDQRLETWRMYQ